MDSFIWWMTKAGEVLGVAGPPLLAVAGFIVAVVALNINYRNANGRKPSLLLTRWYLSESNKTDEMWLNASVEIWNRRKYPILMRGLRLRIDPIKYERLREVERHPENEKWSLGLGNAVLEVRKEVVIQPGEFESFKVAAVCNQQGPFPHTSNASLRAMIFDPKKNKHIVMERESVVTWDVPDW